MATDRRAPACCGATATDSRTASRPASTRTGSSSWVLGASITAVELPTAFPYFAAIAAIVGANVGPVRAVSLLFLFNVCFVLPAADRGHADLRARQLRADPVRPARSFLQRHWPAVLAALALAAGLFVVLLGVTGIGATHSRFLRHLHRTLHG